MKRKDAAAALIFLVSLSEFVKLGSCANILYVEPVPSPSHHIWNKRLSYALAEKGHNVTVLTHDIDKDQVPKNITSIILEGVYEAIHEYYDYSEFAEDDSPESFVRILEDWANFHCALDLKTKGLQELLDYPKDFFDLIIFDVTTGQCLYPLLETFKFPPAIAVTAFLLPPYVSFAFGNDLHTSYIPFYAAPFTDEMSIVERMYNTYYVYYQVYVYQTRFYETQRKMAAEKFGSGTKALGEYENHFSLVLANTDPLMDYPQSLPPNIIPVGGLHARKPKKLPQDLEKLANESKQGFVVFSLGTNMRSDQIGEERISVLLDTFRKLPQTVFWKYESDNLENVPKNVVIRKWLPINDLLGHQNAKLFITHGGALSTQEAMFHGIPIVGVPLFADQHVNLKKMETKNLGLVVNFRKFTFGDFYGAVKEVLNNPLYRKSIKDLSRRYKDQPQTPLDRAVFYVEYLLRNGPEFPSVASRHMPFYKSQNLDVFVIFACLIFATIYFLTIMIRLLFLMYKNLFSTKTKVKSN